MNPQGTLYNLVLYSLTDEGMVSSLVQSGLDTSTVYP